MDPLLINRNEAMIAAAIAHCKVDPHQRIGWGKFLRMGMGMGLSQEAAEHTLFHCFDLFEWSVEVDGEILDKDASMAAIRAALCGESKMGDNALIFYKFKG